MTAAAVGGLVGLALLACLGARVSPSAIWGAARGDGARGTGVARPASGRWAGRARTGRARSGPARDAGRRAPKGVGADDRLAALLIEVAALLRAGAAPQDAWQAALGVAVPDRVPDADDLAAAIGVSGSGWWRHRRLGSTVPPVEAVVAAARVADELGAPLAAVLEEVARAIATQAEADGEVAAALAAPRSSARVLAWLPAAGLLLGTALGADPLGVLAGGGIGSASGVAGAALLLAGRRWTAAMLRRAQRAGEPA